MGAFKGLKDAKRGFQSNPIKPGEYVVRIDGNDYFETKMSGEKWKVTATVLAVLEGEAHRVGETVHIFYNKKSGKDVFLQNLKSYFCGVLGVDDDCEDIDDDFGDAASSPESPLNGLVAPLKVTQRQHKTAVDEKTGEPVFYNVYGWSESLDPKDILDALPADVVKKYLPDLKAA